MEDEAVRDVLARLVEMRGRRVWPNGTRYLWTDAFGVVLLVSLFHHLHRREHLDQARWVVAEVERVLGRPHGLRIGEAPDRDGQYFHYIAMWLYALGRLGAVIPSYRERAVRIAKDVHPRFVQPDVGVHWKMKEDLSAPYPGFGFGALDAFHGLVVYRDLAPRELAPEIADMARLVEHGYRSLVVTQDLGLGMLLWITHMAPHEGWAVHQRRVALAMLDRLWIDPPGYFCREPSLSDVKYAFTNYGVAIGLQAAGVHPERVARVNAFFDTYRSGDEYDTDAITHVMACASRFPGELIRAPRTEDLRGGW